VARFAPEIDETRALTRLAFDELAGAARGIGDIQLAVAGRVFTFVGPGGVPVRLAHDAITGGVYAALHGGARLAGLAAATALPASRRAALSTDPRGAAVLAAINGLIGDALEREGSPLTAPMAVRVDGEPVAVEPEPLAAAFPAATGRLVVFLHGLMETEFAWRLGGRATYGERLARDLGVTAVDVRYNSGRRVSQNGRALCELLEALVAAWPEPVTEIALVGHSMGGLVARSACHRASLDDAAWVRHVRHVVSLGTPHMGAPLEQAVHAASAALSALPETRPFGRFLRRRSGGIRDLQHGSLVDEDWEDRDPDALRHAACEEVPLLDGVKHCFVSATVTRDPRHPVGRVVGDWLVLQNSASGRGRTRRLPFREEDGLHVGGAGHLALLNHPAVYEKLREWLASA
jgi:pimeloyl-ACP methyl ester carboxylesterase